MKFTFGMERDTRWKIKLVAAIVLETLLVVVCLANFLPLKIAFICSFIYGACLFIKVDINIESQIPFFAITTFVLGFICLNLSQLVMNENISRIAIRYIFYSIILYVIIVSFFYCLFPNYAIANTLSFVLILGLSTINYYVFLFRGCELMANDLLSIRTAMNVVREYKICLTVPIIYSWAFLFTIVYVLFFTIRFEKSNGKKFICRFRSGILFVIMSIGLVILTDGMTVRPYSNCGTIYNGLYLNFALTFREGHVQAPTGYSKTMISQIENDVLEYGTSYNGSSADSYPNIIVIMNESFADLSVLGELNGGSNMLSYYESLNTDIIKGYALSSVYGGGTPSSEYEFLSGNTMGFLPGGAIAYQQYIKAETYSIVEIFRSLNYHCISMHPYYESGWMRAIVYPLLGFEDSLFIQDFPQENLIRDYVSDKEMYDQVIAQYENKVNDQPLFLFGVTMQNHGGYDYDGDNFEQKVTLSGLSQEFSDVEQYLSLIQSSDKALETLVEYFKTVDEDTIIVFYGDHQPNLNNIFLEEVHGGFFDTLDEQELLYKVPFFIWANYDIEEEYIELTSLNFLSNYLFKVAGIELPAYNQFLLQVQNVIPAMNSQGYYSVSDGHFRLYNDAEEKEAEVLNQYRILQYNMIFDDENHSEIFFPTDSIR